LDSAFAQDSSLAEVVVIDGASTDGTTEILERNASRLAYHESRPDRGVYHAWNKALGKARGEWLIFLGADDRLAAPDVLARILPHLSAALMSGYRVVYGSIRIASPEGDGSSVMGAPWEQIRAAFRERMTLPNPATFYHRSLFAAHGPFDERFRIAGDYEFLMRELLVADALFVPEMIVANMAEGGLSSDPRLRPRRLRERAMARHRHGLTVLPSFASPLVIRAYARSWLERSFGVEATTRLARRLRGRVGRAPGG
jgi:glycosyltransferase involved in cell wall biosynthesis